MPEYIKVGDLSLPGTAVYAGPTENELRHYYEPEGGLFIAESPNVILRALAAGYVPQSFLIEEGQLEREDVKEVFRREDVPVYLAEEAVLRRLTGFPMTRGILSAMYRKTLPAASELLKGARRAAVLENVMNPTNVGAIFRSAAAMGMDAVFLTSGCSDPLYRRAARVSMGTVFQVPWTYLPSEGPQGEKMPGIDPELFRRAGFRVASMALTDDSVGIDDPRLRSEERLAVVLGTESEGLKPETIAGSDYVVKIPMAHGVDSLNVAAASAVAFWELGRCKGD